MPQDPFSGPGFPLGIAVGVVVGWVTLWSFLKPAVGRIVVRVLGVAAVGVGVNFMVAAIGDRAVGNRDVRYDAPFGLHGGFGAVLGWGVGGLVIGVLTLVLSFLGTRRKAEVPGEVKSVRPLEERVLS